MCDPPPWMWVPEENPVERKEPCFSEIIDWLKDSFKLWYYWRNHIYKEDNDFIKNNIVIYPYFTDMIEDEYKELQCCLLDLKNPILVNQIYYEYRGTDMYSSNHKLIKLSYRSQYTAWAIDLDIGVYFYNERNPNTLGLSAYFGCETTKSKRKQRCKYRREFISSINMFVHHYVYKRKLEVLIMNDYKARLWRDGMLTNQIKEQCRKFRLSETEY